MSIQSRNSCYSFFYMRLLLSLFPSQWAIASDVTVSLFGSCTRGLVCRVGFLRKSNPTFTQNYHGASELACLVYTMGLMMRGVCGYLDAYGRRPTVSPLSFMNAFDLYCFLAHSSLVEYGTQGLALGSSPLIKPHRLIVPTTTSSLAPRPRRRSTAHSPLNTSWEQHRNARRQPHL